MADQQQQESAKKLYEKLSKEREPYIKRAEKCAEVTIPALFPKESDGATTDFKTPYQSLGARGVNALAAKLMLALLPPNAPFFRLNPESKIEEELKNHETLNAKIQSVLRTKEKRVMDEVDGSQIRVTLAEALKQLVVAGNGLLYLPPDRKGIKLYRLPSYVLQRDPLGNILQIITLEKIAYSALPKDLQSTAAEGQDIKPETVVEVYTRTYLEEDQYYSYQEINEKKLAVGENTYPKDLLPWIAPRLVKVDGESYGRSYVEEYLGDLLTFEKLTKAIGEVASIAATAIYLVNPAGMTRISKVVKTENGGFAPGRRADIEALQLDKFADMQFAMNAQANIEARLQYVFLLNSAVQRQGERVTAEEIRYVAGELEDTLGGIYSILSQELQLPLARILIDRLQQSKEIDIPGDLNPQIVTGIEALGRGVDLRKLEYYVSFAIQVTQAAQAGIKRGGCLALAADSLGLDKTLLVMSDEEIQAMMMAQQQQMQEQQMQGQVQQEAASAVIKSATEQ